MPSVQAEFPLKLIWLARRAHRRIQSYCKVCTNQAWRDWYGTPKNKERQLSQLNRRRRRRIARNRAIVAADKNQPCADCGGSFPPYAMDFDHLRDKENEIPYLVYSCSPERLIREIEKCEVVCANCHRTRRHRRSAAKKSKGTS